MIRGNRFNLNLQVILVLLALCSCRTDEGRRMKADGTVRVYLEVNADRTNRNRQVPVYRDNPVQVTIDAEPFLTEEDVSEARVVEVVGGFALRISFGQRGAYLLEQTTGSNRGKHYVIQCQFASLQDPKVNESRWLAAPLIGARISDGVLLFTPDASRDEAYQITHGLNNVAKKNKNTPADIQKAKEF